MVNEYVMRDKARLENDANQKAKQKQNSLIKKGETRCQLYSPFRRGIKS